MDRARWATVHGVRHDWVTHISEAFKHWHIRFIGSGCASDLGPTHDQGNLPVLWSQASSRKRVHSGH